MNTVAPVPAPAQHSRGGPDRQTQSAAVSAKQGQSHRDPCANPNPRPQAIHTEGKPRGRQAGGAPGPPDTRPFARGAAPWAPRTVTRRPGPSRPPEAPTQGTKNVEGRSVGPDRREQAPLLATRREPPAPHRPPQSQCSARSSQRAAQSARYKDHARRTWSRRSPKSAARSDASTKAARSRRRSKTGPGSASAARGAPAHPTAASEQDRCSSAS